MEVIYYFLGTSTFFWIFQLIFPYEPSKKINFLKIEQNKKKYNVLEMLAIPLFFLSVALICFSVYALGIVMRDNLFSKEYNYILEPTGSYFVCCGAVLGLGLIRVPMEFIYKLILKDEYYLYNQYTNLKYGFDGEKIWRPMEIIITFCGIILFILGMNWYVRLDKDNNIEINELFSLKTHIYNITEISGIEYYDFYITDKGVEKDIKHYLVKMSDGYEWNTKTYSFFSVQEDQGKIKEKIEQLSEFCNIKIYGNP